MFFYTKKHNKYDREYKCVDFVLKNFIKIYSANNNNNNQKNLDAH